PRLLRRSCAEGERTALFAARCCLSRACFLFAYPAAGWLVPLLGAAATLGLFAVAVLAASAATARLWPAGDPRSVPHVHARLPADHPHLRGAGAVRAPGGWRHEHELLIDDLHPRWPAPGGRAGRGRRRPPREIRRRPVRSERRGRGRAREPRPGRGRTPP